MRASNISGSKSLLHGSCFLSHLQFWLRGGGKPHSGWRITNHIFKKKKPCVFLLFWGFPYLEFSARKIWASASAIPENLLYFYAVVYMFSASIHSKSMYSCTEKWKHVLEYNPVRIDAVLSHFEIIILSGFKSMLSLPSHTWRVDDMNSGGFCLLCLWSNLIKFVPVTCFVSLIARVGFKGL